MPVPETWEITHSRETMDAAVRFLEGRGYAQAQELRDLYEEIEPFLIAGRQCQPVFHTPYVVGTAALAGVENRLDESMLRRLLATALCHDGGYEGKETKIRVKDIRTGKYTVRQGIDQRERHMVRGAERVPEVLSRCGWHGSDIEPIARVVRHHDAPSIAELLHGLGGNSAAQIAAHLFCECPPMLQTSLRHLREADRAFMLTPLDVAVDVRRDRAKEERAPADAPGDEFAAKLRYNVDRHLEEGQLMEEFCHPQPPGLGPGDGLYTSLGGKRLLACLTAYTAALPDCEQLIEAPEAWDHTHPGQLLGWIQ